MLTQQKRGGATAVKLFMLGWMLMNLLALPLTFAQEGPEVSVSIISQEPSLNGGWGKVVSIGNAMMDIELSKRPARTSETPSSGVHPALIAFLILALAAFSWQGNSGRKGQITVFILLGLTILIAFFFMFYMTTSTSTQTKENLDQATRTLLDSSAIKYYVYTCLDQAAADSLKQLGYQGGFIHQDQPGAIIDWEIPYYPFELDGQIHNVSYQIYSQTSGLLQDRDLFIRDDPSGSAHNYYPCKQGYTTAFYDSVQGEICLEDYDHTLDRFGTLGKRLIRSGSTGLSSTANRRVIPDLCSDPVELNIYKCSCPLNHECDYSIQRQLESAIKNRTMECLDFSSFSGYTITYEEPNVTVAVDADDIGVMLDLPLSIKWKDGIPQTLIQQFHSLYFVRLKVIHPMLFGGNLIVPGYGAMNNITGIVNDELKIDYRVIQDSQPVLNILGGLQITAHQPDPSVTIVVINDTQSNLGGYPYLFMFAIENRKPALDWFEDNPYSWNGDQYQVMVTEGDTIHLAPYAVDPDETMVSYAYSGWRVDWDDEFDETAASVGDMIITALLPPGTNDWHLSPPYLAGCVDPYGENIIGRCASYVTSRRDVGYHNITITVSDTAGEQDWQMVRILVDDLPEVVIRAENYYSDIPDQYASIEDNYLMDVSSTTDIIGTGPLTWLWEDTLVPTLIPPSYQTFQETNDILLFPTTSPTIVDIDSISASPPFPGVGLVDITVHSKRGSGDAGSRTYTINVTECLPHRSSAAPYPWNTGVLGLVNAIDYDTEHDPFQADHTCCDDDFTRRDAGVCYAHEDYGAYDLGAGYRSYSTPGVATLSPSTVPIQSVHNIPGALPSDIESFDAYRRDFRVSCDGSRGNTCHSTNANTGHILTRVLDCYDHPTFDPGCSYGAYGSVASCSQVPPNTAIDYLNRRIEPMHPCGPAVCSTNQVGGIVAPGGGACVGPFCYQCTPTCNGAGRCQTIISCTGCTSCTNTVDPLTGDITGSTCIA